MSDKFFITTPIYYINDVPHIGHTCTTLAADFLARLHRQQGDEVFFLTGTDEHGQKVAESAEKENLSPQAYCDQIAPRFDQAWKSLNISHDFFIRTTDPRHEQIVSDFLTRIHSAQDVYKAKYEGYYCIGCEKFITETELVDQHCPIHPPEKTVHKSEDNWFFRLSKYVPKLIELIENDQTNYIYPEGKRSEVLAKLKAGVNDVSISRESVKWGIPTPWDPSQTVYVWFDALINYYSATQFVEGKSDFWPASLHLLGKEILWFHTVIWQAMLLSANLPLPHKTYTHSFYMIDGQKMSKSLGNVISPGQLVDLYGVDGARYLIARSFPSENDSDVGLARFTEKYNADLANNLGNLVSRICKLGAGQDFGPINPSLFDHSADSTKNPSKSPFNKGDFNTLIEDLKFDEAISYIFTKFIDSSNELLNINKPWTLSEDDPTRLDCLSTCRSNLLQAAHCLWPFMPDTCDKITALFSGPIQPLSTPLFPRIK